MRCFPPGRRHVPSRDGGRGEEEMPPVKTREPLIEEKVFGGIAKGWAYLVYAIRQIIIYQISPPLCNPSKHLLFNQRLSRLHRRHLLLPSPTVPRGYMTSSWGKTSHS